ncbi:MAG TPA: hypothetical protein VF334_07775 [Polyangia bacterium]
MNELPPELGVDAAVAIIAAVDGGRGDFARGFVAAAVTAGLVEVAAAALLWRVPDRHWGAAIAACVAFPVAARLARRLRLMRLRRLEPARLRERAEAAWRKASPGQRAALQMIITKPR